MFALLFYYPSAIFALFIHFRLGYRYLVVLLTTINGTDFKACCEILKSGDGRRANNAKTMITIGPDTMSYEVENFKHTSYFFTHKHCLLIEQKILHLYDRERSQKEKDVEILLDCSFCF